MRSNKQIRIIKRAVTGPKLSENSALNDQPESSPSTVMKTVKSWIYDFQNKQLESQRRFSDLFKEMGRPMEAAISSGEEN